MSGLKYDSILVEDLDGRELLDIPEESFFKTSLTKLCAATNRLSYISPRIGLFASLCTLVLDHNFLSAIPYEVGLCSNLTYLSVVDNALTTLPTSISTPPALATIRLSCNKIQRVPDSIGNWRNAELVWLAQNLLEKLPPLHYFQCTELALNDNNLRALPSLAALTCLKTLLLDCNDLCLLDGSCFASSHLSRLSASKNRIHTIDVAISSSTSLKSLDLHENCLRFVPDLSKLSNLSTLDLSGNAMDQETNLWQIPHLHFLKRSHSSAPSIWQKFNS